MEYKFKNLEFSKQVFARVIHDLWENGNLRSLIYNTIFYDSTKLLFDMFVESGLGAYVGKVNMDLNVPDYLLEDTEQSLIDTERFILETKNTHTLVKPIIAPRFVPSCTPKLMRGLGDLAKIYHVPVMSHLSEDLDEIKIVKEMYPNFKTYADIYRHFGLFGQEKTCMGHCIYSDERERKLIKEYGVWVGHCPSSNFNLGSGLMPVRKFLDLGIKVGLGCDVAGGGSVSLLGVMQDALATSKIVWLYSGKKIKPLIMPEVFHMATKGGGSFFGKVGSFEPGYEFDALIIDDAPLLEISTYSIEERITRFIFIGSKENIVARYISGRYLPKPTFI